MPQLYVARLRPRSPLATPLRGDTLWGHLCWALRNHLGETRLTEFLSHYDNGEMPIVFSDGFPAEYLPVPQLKPVRPPTAASDESYKREKTVSFFHRSLSTTPLSMTRLIDARNEATVAQHEFFLQRRRTHNTVNRLTSTTGDGGNLYQREEFWNVSPLDDIELYVVSEYTVEETRKMIELSVADGYGADRSTGFGALDMTTIEPVVNTHRWNRCMALGAFVPSTELTDLRADVNVKFGKLGDVWAHHPNPFKRPIMMFDRGATFSWNEQPPPPVVGRVLSGVHPDQRIRHLAACPVVPIFDEGYTDEP